MGTIENDPALFGTPSSVTYNTPIELAQALADFFKEEGLYWADPCSNEGSILLANISVMLPGDEKEVLRFQAEAESWGEQAALALATGGGALLKKALKRKDQAFAKAAQAKIQAERREVFALGVKKGVFVQLGEDHFADAERTELEYLLADGLQLDWDDLAGGHYVNPPFGFAGTDGCVPWLRKAAACKRADVIMLLPARTETKPFQEIIFPTCDALCFWAGRLTFFGEEDPAPFPSVLIYWGSNAPGFKAFFDKFGRVIIQP